MPASTLTLRGNATSLPIGTINVQPSDVTSVAAIGTRTLVNLSSGNNTITLPTGYTSVIVTPPAGNSTAIVLRGVGGDTGLRVHNTRWNVFHFDSSVTSFVLNAAAGVNNVELTIF